MPDTIRITPNQKFREGTVTFLPDQEYTVDYADGVYYVRNGWADSPDYKPPVQDQPKSVTDIKPDSIRHGVKSKEV